MPFSEIIDKSFKYPWKNRALWFYGILIAIFAGGSSASSSYSPNDAEWVKIQEGAKSIPVVSNINTTSWIIIAVVVLLLVMGLAVVALIISSWATTALNRGVELIEQKKIIDRKEIGKTGKKVVWEMIVLNFFIPLGIVFGISTLIILGVLIFAALPKPFGIYAGVFTGVIAFFALIIMAIYLSVLWPLAVRYVTNEKTNAWESLKMAHALIKAKKKFWLTLGFNIVIGMMASAGVFVAMIPMFIIFIALIAFVATKIYVGAIICGILALGYLVPLIIAQGYLQSFALTGQTLWWLELKKLKKP